MKVCGRKKEQGGWELWIEGKDGNLAVRGLANTRKLIDSDWTRILKNELASLLSSLQLSPSYQGTFDRSYARILESLASLALQNSIKDHFQGSIWELRILSAVLLKIERPKDSKFNKSEPGYYILALRVDGKFFLHHARNLKSVDTGRSLWFRHKAEKQGIIIPIHPWNQRH